MNSPLKKVSLLIITIIVLPLLIFSVFEIGNLRRNEKVIQDIYRNQLDAILYSVNQYSDDIISNLASRIENSSNNLTDNQPTDLARIFNEIPSLESLTQFSIDLEQFSAESNPYSAGSLIPEMIASLKNNQKIISQLQKYLETGYRKIEAIGNPDPKKQWIIFLMHAKDQVVINILVINPEKFISQVLDPKIQQIAKGKFNIAAYRSNEALPFYASDKQKNNSKINNKAPFWLLSNYLMGIELNDLTIADLTRDRVKRNLMIIGIMDTILLLGAFLIFRNVKKQVELSQLKSDFVSGVSHEIRTPLALITMYIETLEMGRVKDTVKIKEYYKIILNETIRLSAIVNRILSFSQIESNKRKYTFVETSLNEIVENAANSLRYSIETKGFSWSFEPDSNLPLIRADREAVTDAFINLVDNAMKYSAEIRDIKVRTGQIDKYVFVEVEDKGIGISQKNQKYIFDKFYRVTELNLANSVKGSGLGLAIVKNIVDAHQGKIFVKSVPGSGSLFRLSFLK